MREQVPDFLPLDPGYSNLQELPLIEHEAAVVALEVAAAVARSEFEARRYVETHHVSVSSLPATAHEWNQERQHLNQAATAAGCWTFGRRIRRDLAIAYWQARAAAARSLGFTGCERMCRLRLVMAKRRI